MNIAIIGKFYTESAANHIEETLQEMGHTTIRVEAEVNFMQYKLLGFRGRNITKTFYNQFLSKIPTIRNIKSNAIHKIYKKNSIDLTIVLHDFLSKQDIDKIKKTTPSPIVLWFPDAISNFQKSMFFVAGYDYLFFVDKYIVEKLKSEFNLNTHYLPQCCNPNSHRIVDSTQEEKDFYKCEITNAGNFYPSRMALYQHLTQYDFKMWGPKPSFWLTVPEVKKMITGKIVHNEEKSKAFSAAKIVLNNLHPAVINGVNKRTFEIPACGGFQITSHREAINELFEIGKEIVTYTDFNDLKAKINYYLDPTNETERQQIIEAGQRRVLSEHTYEKRLKQLLEIIN